MTKQLWFVLVFSVLFGACTAGVAGQILIDAIGDGKSAGVAIAVILLVLTAIVCGYVALGIRERQSPVHLSSVAGIGFTVLYVIGAFVAHQRVGVLLFPACMFVLMVLVPSQRRWLAQGEQGEQDNQ